MERKKQPHTYISGFYLGLFVKLKVVKTRPQVLPLCAQQNGKSIKYITSQHVSALHWGKSKPTWQSPKKLKYKTKKYFTEILTELPNEA